MQEKKKGQIQIRKKKQKCCLPTQNIQTSKKDTWDKEEIIQISYVQWSNQLCKSAGR